MAKITVFDHITNTSVEIDFADLATLIQGSSIKTLMIADDFIEFGLSDAFNLRIHGQSDILLMSTLNKGELPPVRLHLTSGDEALTAESLERQIHSIRQLYATTFLVDSGRSAEIGAMLSKNPQADLEASLSEEDHLFISSASEGSFWLTVVTKTSGAFKSLANIVPLFYDEGRQALLQRVRATTELKQLDVRQKKMEVRYEEANRLVDLVKKIEGIKDPHLRETVRDSLSTSMVALGQQPLLLPKPDSEGSSSG
jgi:hypothetical protein